MMQVIQVTDKKTVNEFHRVPEKIYFNDPNWISPFWFMVENIFTPSKNPKLKSGEAKRWILKKDGKSIGRIAAFYDQDYSSGYDQPTGG